MKRSAAALAARSHWATKRLKQEDDEIEVTAVNELPRLPLLLLNCPSVDANDDTTKVSLILGDEGLRELFQFNFNIDVEFALTLFHDNVLVNQVPITFISGTPGLLMLLLPAARQFKLAEVVADIPSRFGTHHTKMMVNFFDDGVEVVIMTANLTKLDLGGLTQMLWRSGVLPKGRTSNLQGKRFQKDLINYLRRYKKDPLTELAGRLGKYDFLSVTVELVALAPGSFKLDEDKTDQEIYGYGALWQVLKRNNLLVADTTKNHKVLAQVTSISYPLTVDKSNTSNIFTHVLCPLVVLGLTPFHILKPGSTTAHQKQHNYTPELIFPTVDEVAKSSVGFGSGLAVHFSYTTPHTVARQYSQNIRPYLKKWNPGHKQTLGREKITPHVKVYAVDNGDDWKLLRWVMMGSHNLSKQAWGARPGQKYTTCDPTEYDISSYELGVVVTGKESGQLTPVYGSNTILASGNIPVRLPFVLPPVAYGSNDKPWSGKLSYGTLEDNFGNTYNLG